MALQGNDAAFVAVQLTNAWASLVARRNGIGGLSEQQVKVAIAKTYDEFSNAVLASEIGHLQSHIK